MQRAFIQAWTIPPAMAEVAVPRDSFLAILNRIQQLGVPPPLVQCG